MKMHDENSGPKFTAMKRGEQIKRWEDSDINKESSQSRQANKIRFLDSTIFLAACSAGDVEEVKKLLKRGVDINTPNIDGLTALHQACIDDNILMVEFLIKHGANINQGDNEGWTPLHAASSCGFLEIVQYLVKCGANIAAVNSDGELPIDITESLEIEKFLQSEIDRKGIVMNEARNEEINKMTRDAKLWIRTNVIRDRPHPKTGATALHVASAKGYTSVIELLLEAGVNIDARDYDGWTPLHAACHWNQKEAVRTLLNHGADPGLKDNSSLIPAEVGDNAMARYMDDIKNENKLCKEKMTTILAPTKTTVNITHNIPIKSKQAQPLGAESETHSTTVSRMSGVEKLRLNTEDHASERNINLSGGANNKKFKAEVPHEEETASSSSASSSSLTTSSSSIESGKIAAGVKKLSQTNIAAKDVEKPEVAKVKYSITAKTTPQPTVHATEEKITITKPKMLTTINKKEIGKPIANKETSDSGSESEDSSEASTSNTSSTSSSHHSDDHLKKGENKLNNAVKLADSRIGVGNTKEKSTVTFTGTSPVTQHQKPSSFVTPLQTPANTVKPQQHTFTPMNTRLSISSSSSSSSSTHNNTMLGGLLTKRTPSSANIGLQQSSLASSASSVLSDQVSSQREVASEAQRKARSKRARESRRSTQGVSAEDIKAAEKQLEEIDIRSNSPGNEKQITTSKITKDEPSQKLPTSSSSSILNIAQKMEEKTARVFPLLKNNESNISNDTNTSSSQSNGGSNSSTNRRPVKDYEERRKILEEQRQKALEERKAGTTANKMELSGKPPQVFPTNATSNSIPPTLESKRHLREKRRSTGICSFNVEKQSDQLPGDNSRDTKVHEDYSKEETNPANYEESHSANYHSRNRVVSSTTAKTSTASNINDNTATIDYKKLYDETRLENVKLKSKIKDLEKELQTSKGDRKILAEIKPSSDYNSDNSSQSTLSRKEKRNLEIKISELEEELKKMESLKEVNQRLKHENGALIRVISKLSK
ncbi:protein phosphatase 1 regulatory subunit 12A-like isoform X5 [Gordionus sp. m RMFG-2023]|uniref:protein phosphatase 1 regulatory subunit 12A-like isoform X5 n=1 Tax=Gordionus sp. m RMFG-2023 TaxID=3053472 RepID=UPI0031FDBBD8